MGGGQRPRGKRSGTHQEGSHRRVRRGTQVSQRAAAGVRPRAVPLLLCLEEGMNEITIIGNVTADPVLRKSANGRGVTRFDVAVNRRRFNRGANPYDNLAPVFHRVVAFGRGAENAADTLRKGLEVVVVGQIADDSYETEAGEKRRQVVLEAQVIAPSLRFAKANVIRVQREQPAPEPEG